MGDSAPHPPGQGPSHLYGGQAVLEGVMMRGAGHWALAVRKPSGDIHIESHEIRSIVARHPLLSKPFLRGVIVLGQSVTIGVKALMIAAGQASDEDVELSSRQVGLALAVAAVLFVGVFVLGPAALFTWIQRRGGNGVVVNVSEGVFRVALFVGYLWLIGRTKDVHRVFEYHGAEHKTIAAYEHQKPLDPAEVDRFPKEHVRCGTNLLIIVMIVTIFVFTLVGTPGIAWRLGSRVLAIPLIAGLSYEALRLGARFPNSAVMRALMTPGIWLQKITTQEPDLGQIEVAIASFQEVRRREAEVAGR
ncbi:MAG: DUF1385 domain-containing protein [Actinomycetota bacterium]|nr:DUF1385 domain-containing protein [Actinomycetota bacterium]